MTTIYIHGCSTCGANSVYVAKVRSARPSVRVFNTRVDKERLAEHIEYQKQAGMTSSPLPIVVDDGGRAICLLKEWKP